MLAQEFTAIAEARIQDEIARFLALKSVLIRLQGSSNPIVADRATQLYAQQVTLEQALTDTMKRIDNIKQGAYTMSDITAISSFSYALRKHIQQVENLAGGQSTAGVGFGMPAILLGGLVIVGAVFMFRNKGGRKR